MDGTSTFVIIVFLATAIERTIEAVTSPLFDALKEGKYGLPEWKAGGLLKRFAGVVLGLGAGFAVAFGLGLDLFTPLLQTLGSEQALDSAQAKVFTGILLGGGSAPVHELIRYVEEKKQKAGEEKEKEKANRILAEREAGLGEGSMR